MHLTQERHEKNHFLINYPKIIIFQKLLYLNEKKNNTQAILYVRHCPLISLLI